MKELQVAIRDYLSSKRLIAPLFKINSALAMIYPIYLVLSKVPFLSKAWKYVGMLSALYYFAYVIGIVLCFAVCKWLPLDIAFVGMGFYYLLNIQMGITFNRLFYLAVYGTLAGICIVQTRKSAQWRQLIHTYKATEEGRGQPVKVNMTHQINAQEAHFCPNCGTRIPSGMKFCNNCGTEIQ